jgi:hypothetical protein
LCLELAHGGRVISLPGDEDTVRGYSGPNLVVIDEAARVPDDLYRAIRPMLAVSGGRLICLSTPNGTRGFFYHAWMDQASDWLRFEVPASQVPRISQEHLDRELRSFGETWYNQEYACRFEAREGLVYPDMPGCVVDTLPPEIAQTSSEHLARRLCSGRLIGGIDFGFSDPMAAVWGLHDKSDDILWIVGEFYAHKQTLDRLAKALPRTVLWNADPSAALEIRELHRADFKIRPADNSVEPGIMAVTSRIDSGRLKILRSACPHLLEEAQLYHRDAETGKPADKDNHVMDALRYLVSRLDHGFLARVRRTPSDPSPGPGRSWLSIWNEQLWKPLNY